MIYAKPSSALQQHGGICPDGWVEMSGPRPASGNWIADTSGRWVAVVPTPDGMRAMREAAYRIESDPIFMEARYDDDPVKLQEWRDKVAEIKNRYPINGG